MSNKPIKSVNLLPEFFRTEKNSKFLASTIDQLIQPPKLERIDGFIGTKNTPTYKSETDDYITETSPLRRDYQLEPALVIKDESGNIEQVKAIDDLANELATEGGIVNNFDRLFKPEIHSYNPHIDFDKLVNYQQYYWLPTGPITVDIAGLNFGTVSTYTVTDNSINSAWVFTPDGLTEDPQITLFRGNTYRFEIKSKYPFYIKTAPSLGYADVYNFNVSGNGLTDGTLYITVDENTPSILYYTSDLVNYTQGQIVIKDPFEDSSINVELDVLGKKSFTSGNGVTLSNGMKIRFAGKVIPEEYSDREFIVEGVGHEIKLIDYSLLTGSKIFSSTLEDNFDAETFDKYPFDTFKTVPINPEYLTINRASKDLNPWTRYNRWFHADVITASALATGQVPQLPTSSRATRPIIEFKADLKLFNFGTTGVRNVDLIDNDTADAFSIVEGSAIYHIDGIKLEQGHRVIFNADIDPAVRGKIYEVNYRIIDNRYQIDLVEAPDFSPEIGYSLAVNYGVNYSGKSWWYNGDVWVLAQQHESLNQAPLFDLFDKDGISYSSGSVYNSNFSGNKIFSYADGTVYDSVLGFSIKYKTTAKTGVGSWMFANNLTSDTFSIFENNKVTTVSAAKAFCKYSYSTGDVLKNAWDVAVNYDIPVLQFTVSTATSIIEITSLSQPIDSDTSFTVFVNNVQIDSSKWQLVSEVNRSYIQFNYTLDRLSNVLIKARTKTQTTNSGWYETPVSLTNNPLNGSVSEFTLTELTDHFKTMAEVDIEFYGNAVGSNNSRDLPFVGKTGSRLISNANPIAFAAFFLGIKEHNAVDAITKSADQYNQFKLAFLKKIAEFEIAGDPKSAVDIALSELNSDKDLNSPWYDSDMIAYGNDKEARSWIVTDSRNISYPIKSEFNTSALSTRSVLVYLNDIQLTHGVDYQFNSVDSFVEFLKPLVPGDRIVVDDYYDTSGSYVPATPSKLGLYPKFEPQIIIDNTYAAGPTKVIQGHDGSLMVAYNDYRDNVVLEFEKRIFNNIKAAYRPELLDAISFFPGAFRETEYSVTEVNKILQKDFMKWAGFYGVDAFTNSTFDYSSSLTWNCSDSTVVATGSKVRGNWRSIFKHLYDTERPGTHPWEMLGFSNKPSWWESEYGIAPYTSGNDLLWEDLSKGIIRQGHRAGVDIKYVREGLLSCLPVDEFGNNVSIDTLVTAISPADIYKDWQFGDFGPAETAWRRSSYWPFAVQRLLAVAKPSTYASMMYDTSDVIVNPVGQKVSNTSELFLNLNSVKVSGYNGALTSGYSVYVSEIGKQRSSNYLKTLAEDLAYSNFSLFYKVGGFVSKDKLQIIIDAIEPNSTSPGALLPQEDYELILNVSNPVKTVTISGIVIQKTSGKFVLKGYDQFSPYFNVLMPIRNTNTPAITIGGISEPYVNWSEGSAGSNNGLTAADTTTAQSAIAGNFYSAGQIVSYRNKFYRVKVSHQAGSSFNPSLYQILQSLPVNGGATVQVAASFENTTTHVPYGTTFERLQDVFDVIVGYGKWLETQGFVFDQYSADLDTIVDWNLSSREFLYWTTQNWADNSVITLSPFADNVKFSLPNSVVDNIFDSFYEYRVLKADGLPISKNNLTISRNDGVCVINTINTVEGIYFAELNSVQKEHAMVFNNKTVFNDTIYEIETGYRQRRMKLSGFRTAEWNGDYFSPGFVYDTALIDSWKEYTDYKYGDIVKFTGKYYSAIRNITGAAKFSDQVNSWTLVGKKPVADLIPNFDYKINQFEDFYSLDIDNFDASQQKMAQHLIGYTPRVYLNNVFSNPIAQYKFYQGYIREKGTKNAITKLAKASIFNLQGEVSYTEDWAFRQGQYGSYSSYQEIELPLIEGSFVENPQIINIVDQKPNEPVDLINYITKGELLITPEDYDVSKTFKTTSTNNFVLNSAGYVSFEDITATAYNENSLLDIASTSDIAEGDVFWLGFKQNGDWDILRYELNNSRVAGVYVSNPGSDITFVTDLHHGLSVGDIISINQFSDQVNGVYRVTSVPKLNQFTVPSDLTYITNEELLSPGLLYEFSSARIEDHSKFPSDLKMLRAPTGSKFWVDNQENGSYKWQVLEKTQSFNTYTSVSSTTGGVSQKFGSKVYKNSDSTIILVGSPEFLGSYDNGRVYVFNDIGFESERVFNYSINTENIDYYNSDISEFGSAICYSSNEFSDSGYGLIVAGAPAAGNIRQASTVGLKVSKEYNSVVNSTESGLIKISSVNPILIGDVPQFIISSPNSVDYQRFGASVDLKGDTLLVGAPGTLTTGTGAVYEYQLTSPATTTYVQSTALSGNNLIYLRSTEGVEQGMRVWIKDLFEDIIQGPTVVSIGSNELGDYIKISTNLAQDINQNSKVQFYDISNLKAYTGISTSTTGLMVSYVAPLTTSTLSTGSQWGYSLSKSVDASYVAISAPGSNQVSIFSGSNYSFLQNVEVPSFVESGDRFGDAVKLSNDGTVLLVTVPQVKNINQSTGAVIVYINTGTAFAYDSTIYNPIPGSKFKFGTSISIDDDSSSIAISAVGSITTEMTVDNNSTTFDAKSTKFYSTVDNCGTVYIFKKLSDSSRYVLCEEVFPIDSIDELSGSDYGRSIVIANDTVVVAAPTQSSGKVYQFTKTDPSISSLNVYKKYDEFVDTDVIQKVMLIDVDTEQVIDYLDLFDPIKGKIPGIADQEIRYKTSFDPALYSIGTASTNNDVTSNWLDDHVGELWWDLSTVKYVWYEQGSLSYRKNNWGTLFPGATIDVYEWVSSQYLPSEWSAIADTPSGLTEGISGQPKFVDNSTISVKQVYNSLTNSFTNRYYYWVKNKVTVPTSKNRRISSYQVSSIISNPTSYGLKIASLISKDAMILSNVGDLLVGDSINLNIAFDEFKGSIPKHTEWALIQEGSDSSMPTAMLEKKLIDSLLGHDSLGNPVPDPSLSERTRYGISIRPRQTLFKDRKAALRNLVEFVNSVLLENQITGNYSFENLLKEETVPVLASGEYDEIVEDNELLTLVDVRYIKTAKISCSVDNGKVVRVSIDDPGLGYKTPPKVTVMTGSAEIKLEIDGSGSVTSAQIIDPGHGYDIPPDLEIRPFTVIVLSDSISNGKWAKFIRDTEISEWVRVSTQTYNTRLYWDYVDWQSQDFNKFVDYTETVDYVYQLDTLIDIVENQYVKVKNVGDGRYVVLRKTNTDTGTFGKGYDLVYSQNGTIQIQDRIWNTVGNNLGFDSNNNYDQTLYDQTPDIELSYILKALKSDIFVNELKINWNLLFFKAVRYALSEQKILDWAFKTSFISVTNYAGSLDQRPVYKLQDSAYYEDYIKEVKPYHTQIRSFSTNYDILEPSNTFTTDFDFPPYFNTQTLKIDAAELSDSVIEQHPWKSWSDNYLYKVGSVGIGDVGEGYKYPPTVIFNTADGDTGGGASAKAYVTSGKVTYIEILNPGANYRVAPTIVLDGGGYTKQARAYAQLVNGKVRTNKVGIKFDRVSSSPEIDEHNVVDRFLCDGSTSEYVLSWLADANKLNITVLLDGDLVLGSEYKLVFYDQVYNGYHKKYSKIVFVNQVPEADHLLEVRYDKNIELYNAAERITKFYKPTAGMPGNDLAQVMDGIDFPGTVIEGLTFDYNAKWGYDYSSYGKFSWADSISSYKTASVLNYDPIHKFFEVNSVDITVGMLVNALSDEPIFADESVFVSKVEIQVNTSKLYFSSDIINQVVGGLVIEFWKYDENSAILDTSINGGTFIDAFGVDPARTIVDGSGFISQDIAQTTEELVPGFVADSIGINVYTRNSRGAPIVFSGSADVSSYSTTTVQLMFVPPNKDSIFVTYNNRIFIESTSTTFSTLTNSSLYYIDWVANTLTISPQSSNGILGYNIVGIGGGRSTLEAGVIDRDFAVSEIGTTEAQVYSLSSADTVKSAYVTVNGSSITSQYSTSTPYYVLGASSDLNRRASVHVYNLTTTTANAVQAWFFGTENKYYNEFKEQTFTVTSPSSVFALEQPPGMLEPAAVNMIVELNDGSGFRKLAPPTVVYYKYDASTEIFAVEPPNLPVSNAGVDYIRVYVNGKLKKVDLEYNVTIAKDFVQFNPNILFPGDAIAVLSVRNEEASTITFDVVDGDLVLNKPVENSIIRATSFTNHDDMMVTVEKFAGRPSRRFTLTKSVLNDNYVWVDVNGIPLVNKIDYKILEDSRTIEIGDRYNILSTDLVTITVITSDKLASTVLGYRVFNDVFERTSFKRLSKGNSTVLSAPLTADDIEIHVVDAAVLTPPTLDKKIPGVVVINGERIEFFSVVDNTLTQLRRSTLGTGLAPYLEVGTPVIDQGSYQTIPYAENQYKQIIYTTNTNSYVISTVTTTVVNPLNSNSDSVSDGIKLQSDFDTLVSGSGQEVITRYSDQVQVYYGGRLLRKDGYYLHDISLAYDSQEADIVGSVAAVQDLPSTNILGESYLVTATNEVWVYENSKSENSVLGYLYNGMKYVEPEFSISVTTNQQLLELNIENGVQENIKLVIVKREFNRTNLWNDQVSPTQTESIMDSTTSVAKFLQARPAELPNRENQGLLTSAGLALTDSNGTPL
jgi:hypothetical protein